MTKINSTNLWLHDKNEIVFVSRFLAGFPQSTDGGRGCTEFSVYRRGGGRSPSCLISEFHVEILLRKTPFYQKRFCIEGKPDLWIFGTFVQDSLKIASFERFLTKIHSTNLWLQGKNEIVFVFAIHGGFSTIQRWGRRCTEFPQPSTEVGTGSELPNI